MSAAEARELASKNISQFSVNQAICKRAHAGLVKARARLLIWHKERRENCDVPEQFWWAEGNTALTQNWTCGDFETWIDERFQCKAYGVLFNRADILEMLPSVPKLDLMADKLETVDVEMPAKDVVQWLSDLMSEPYLEVLRTLRASCANGHITSYCDNMWIETLDRYDDTHEEDVQGEIPEWFWANIVDADCAGLNWKRNFYSGLGFRDGEQTKVRLTGLSFNRDELTILIPDKPIQKTSGRGSAKKSGRPPAEWWDSLWIEICRQLHFGELIPKKQSDIESAMLDWLAAQDVVPSVSTIRKRARPLWDAISREDEN